MKYSTSQDVYVYADESGHSGKHIFEKASPLYYQGAIISVNDIEATVKPIIEKYCKLYNVDRLHGYELGEEKVKIICQELLNSIKTFDWNFHCTIIEKTYIAPTKFIDTFFDSSYNKSITFIWYEVEMFRHMLCLNIDKLLQEDLAKEFWSFYLKNDLENSIFLCEELLTKVHLIIDPRIREIISDGLNFIITNKEEFSQFIGKNKSAYKEHTPNIIAFSSLIVNVHNFCHKRNKQVKEFIHDNSDEFRGTMREYHRKFSGVMLEKEDSGRIPLMVNTEQKLGNFDLKSSSKICSLQVVDLLLWLFQRDSTELNTIKELIASKSTNFYISREMSNIIVATEMYKFNRKEFSDEELKKSRVLLNQLEEKRVKK